MNEIAVVVGTRPEIIKMSPIIAAFQERRVPFFVLHTGQHYSYNLDEVFFEELGLPRPRYNLKVGSGSDTAQVARILRRIEGILARERPSVVLVEGDTNTVLAASLAAAGLRLKIGHVEAGLRSWDRSMPEEINRILTDHLADYLFAPTSLSRENLVAEGIPKAKIFVTGNTIVDAVKKYSPLALKREALLTELALETGQYMLLTLHRQENVDDRKRLAGIFSGLALAHKHLDLPILFPVHPRTRKNMRMFGLKVFPGLRLIQPLGFLDFLLLLSRAKIVVTDSGGIQEEACVIGTPCVTLRENTERPESIEAGANILAGCEASRILAAVKRGLRLKKEWKNPFGDGKAGRRIARIITDRLR
jgi:UDP-N-acetylglucosamine 2-epimerase (non-hydrolysing)